MSSNNIVSGRRCPDVVYRKGKFPSMNPRPSESRTVLRFDAAAIADGDSLHAAPGSLLIEVLCGEARVLAVGSAREVDAHPAAQAAHVDTRPHTVLIPGLVNAHAHLDLTNLGPLPYDPIGGFTGWIEHIRQGRPGSDEDIAAAVRRGVDLAIQGGTAAVGDIAGAPRGQPTLAPWRVLRDSGLAGVSFVEFFAIGRGEESGIGRVASLLEHFAEDGSAHMLVGLSPHAPATVSRRAFAWAVALAESMGLRLTTHLAETVEEREFVGQGTGPLRGLLERVGIWSDEILKDLGHGQTPVGYFVEMLRSRGVLLAHVNDLDDEGLAALAGTGASVAYCPRASTYFGAQQRLGPHRYRDMLAAGINVCLGTDSIVNLPPDTTRKGISVLDEMRLLFRRDGTDPVILLRMATVGGARALGMETERFSFAVGGRPLGIVGVEIQGTPGDLPPLDRVLLSERPARFVWHAKRDCQAGISGSR